MSKRKPKPEHIYREECTAANDPLRNYTRQTFDRKQFDSWKKCASTNGPLLNHEYRFYVGEINWTEES